MLVEWNDSNLSLADLVIINGNIITVDSGFSIIQGVAIKGEKIIAVGSSDDMKKLASKNTQILDIKGASMLPGINDTHCHISDWALSRPPLMLDVRYPIVKSISDIVNMVKKKVNTANPGDWIQGEGWDEGYLNECRNDTSRKPRKEDLDKVAPENPVILVEYSGHRAWVNSQALKRGGITSETPDPVGGRIDRNPITRDPTGLLFEKACLLVRNIVPPWTSQQRKASIPNAMAELNSVGVTSYTDGAVDREKWATYNDAYNEYYKNGKWTCRVNMMLTLRPLGEYGVDSIKQALKYIGARHNFGNEWLRINGAKMIADGIPPLKTAWMYDEYLGGGVGGLVVDGKSPEEQEKNLREMISILHENRYQVGIHSTGARSCEVIMDQFMKCIEADPWDARHYTIHSDFIRPDTIKRVSEYGKRTGYELGMNVQSPIKWTISGLMDTLVGPDKEAYHWPLRTMLDNGIHVMDSSDAPVCYPDWKPGVQSAVLRESKATGKVSGSEQRITVQEAIRNYTYNGAWLDHQENIKGSIEVGKLADFCVIDGDILTTEPHKISSLRNLMTIVGGKIVFNTNEI
jgi:predicted amidohydrolase YtcJ